MFPNYNTLESESKKKKKNKLQQFEKWIKKKTSKQKEIPGHWFIKLILISEVWQE